MKLIETLNAGKLDIVGDIHGEHDALQALLERLVIMNSTSCGTIPRSKMPGFFNRTQTRQVLCNRFGKRSERDSGTSLQTCRLHWSETTCE